jgi:hypothetical protein
MRSGTGRDGACAITVHHSFIHLNSVWFADKAPVLVVGLKLPTKASKARTADTERESHIKRRPETFRCQIRLQQMGHLYSWLQKFRLNMGFAAERNAPL